MLSSHRKCAARTERAFTHGASAPAAAGSTPSPRRRDASRPSGCGTGTACCRAFDTPVPRGAGARTRQQVRTLPDSQSWVAARVPASRRTARAGLVRRLGTVRSRRARRIPVVRLEVATAAVRRLVACASQPMAGRAEGQQDARRGEGRPPWAVARRRRGEGRLPWAVARRRRGEGRLPWVAARARACWSGGLRRLLVSWQLVGRVGKTQPMVTWSGASVFRSAVRSHSLLFTHIKLSSPPPPFPLTATDRARPALTCHPT